MRMMADRVFSQICSLRSIHNRGRQFSKTAKFTNDQQQRFQFEVQSAFHCIHLYLYYLSIDYIGYSESLVVCDDS